MYVAVERYRPLRFLRPVPGSRVVAATVNVV